MEEMIINDKVKEDKLVESMVPRSGTSDFIHEFEHLGFDEAINLCAIVSMSVREHEANRLQPISTIGLLH